MDDAIALGDMLAAARAELGWRPGPHELAGVAAAGGMIVDIRSAASRAQEGELPGAVAIDRNVLEWRLAPTSDHRIADPPAPDQVIVLVCNDGFASSLAAATLRQLGLRRATDLDGGYRAWAAAR